MPVKDEPKPMFVDYTLHLTVDRLVGGIPKHPDIIKRWQEARWPEKASALQPEDPQTPAEAAEVTAASLGNQLSEDEVAGIWTGFAMTPDGTNLAIEERQIKAMLKESANICRTMIPVGGKVIPLRSKLAERVFVKPKWIPLGVSEPTGSIERAIHVMTRQGPRTALKRTDYVDNVKISVNLTVLNDGMIKYDVLHAILTHASLNGLGTDRSQGAGTFEFELVGPAS